MTRKLYIVFIFALASNYLQGEVIARLVKTEGRVHFKRLGMSTFSESAKEGSAIRNGDQVKVGEKSFAAVIYLDDRTVLKVRENTTFSFMDTRNSRTLEIVHGTILNNVKKQGRNKDFRIQTPVSVASVKGTEFAAIVSSGGVDQFICKEGLFEVLNMISGETVNVATGQKAVSNATGNLLQTPASPNEYPPDPEIEEDIDLEPKQESEALEEKPELEQQKVFEPTMDVIESEEIQESETDNLDQEQVEEFDSDVSTEDGSGIEAPNDGLPSKPFSMGLGIGSATLDGVLYNQLALRPEINIGKIGIGLDLVLYIDNEGNMRTEEWDIRNDWGLLLDKILFLRYGKKNDPIWIKYGAIESMTLGYGGLMNNYSNMMEFPSVRRVGVNTGLNIGPVGSELFLSNVKDLSRGGTVIGTRLSYTVSDDIPLTIGLNYILDGNMFSGLKDKDEDSYPDVFDDFPDDSTLWNDTDGDGWPDPGHGDSVPDSLIDIDADGDNIVDSDELTEDILLKAKPFSLKKNTAMTNALSVDIGYPVFTSDLFSLSVYAEYNQLNFPGFINSDSSFSRPNRSGRGLTVPGLRSNILKFLSLSLEYRIIDGAYVPGYFDQAYDLNRVVTSTVDNQTIIRTKDMVIFDAYNDSASSSGLYGSAGINLFNLITFSANYANMQSDTTELKSFSSFLSLNTDNIPKISSAMAYYQRNNDDNPFDFENPTVNTILGYSLGYELSKGVSLIWDFRQFYRDDGTGKLETIQQTNIETAFTF
ncbi:MAG: FecR domain-containing protein [Candidatus Neomarinimicrobiota bacterium]